LCSDYSYAIDSCIKEAEEHPTNTRHTGIQLKHAVWGGDAQQCDSCYRYIKASGLSKHKASRCTKSELRFPQFHDKYFCLFGCSAYEDRLELMGHLISHGRSELKSWGINKTMLRQQANYTLTPCSPTAPKSK